MYTQTPKAVIIKIVSPIRFITDDQEVIDNKFRVINRDVDCWITLDDEEDTFYV